MRRFTRPAAGPALAVLAVAQFIIALDYSIIYVALPSIAHDLQLRPALAQWVISAYAVLFAGFLLVGGRLADRLSARRLFIGAIALFGAASALGAVSQGPSLLLAARAAQGFGAALLQPATLGVIGTTFPPGRERSRALGIWSGVGASGLAVGVILGGVLTTASWRLTFLINVPLTLLGALGATRWFAPAAEDRPAARVPVLASVLGTGAVLALVAGLTESAGRGWSAAATLIPLALAATLLAAFLINELTSGRVLVERLLRHTDSLGIGALATALYMASVGSEFYLVTLLLQSARRFTPLQAGLGFLPLAAMITVGSLAASHAVRRVSAATVLAGAFVVAVVGLGWLAIALHGHSYAADLLPGLIISGAGHGAIYTSMFIIGTQDVPATHQGAAGALLTASQYVSAAVTVAALTLVLGTTPGTAGFRAAFLVTAAAAAVGAAVITVERRRLQPQP